MTDTPEVHYARSADGIDIAYQVVGDGPIDLVFVPGFISHLDLWREVPPMAARLASLAEIARVVVFDKRGTGLSDRSLGFGSVADRADDIRAVMDAAGVERAALYAVSEGGPLALVFAATYPDRVTKLALYGTFARVLWAPDYPKGVDPDVPEALYQLIRERWGTGRVMRWIFPDAPKETEPLLARYERASCSRQLCEEIMRRNVEIDVRDVLPTISVPTLVMHATGDPVSSVEWGRYLAENIRGAEYVEVEGDIHGSWDVDRKDPPGFKRFLVGQDSVPDFDRMLATVLFTDIVSSTERTAGHGDQKWKQLMDHHDRVASHEIERFRGRLVNTTGDGVLATFDGPARAIGCAQSLCGRLEQLGIEIRAGLHTGEIELRSDDITGMGVVIARRICDTASAGDVLVSRTVKELVVGSRIGFADRGLHTLKGVPDDWRLFAVDT